MNYKKGGYKNSNTPSSNTPSIITNIRNIPSINSKIDSSDNKKEEEKKIKKEEEKIKKEEEKKEFIKIKEEEKKEFIKIKEEEIKEFINILDESKHILIPPILDTLDLDLDLDFAIDDLEEINDILFNKINKILSINRYETFPVLLTKFSKIKEDQVLHQNLKRILRIVIVLLHEQEKDGDQIIIKAICKKLLDKSDYTLIKDIKEFYEFTTGNELNI